MIKITKYTEDNRHKWEKFHDKSSFNIFLMRRLFMDHHREKFIDASSFIEINSEVIAIIAACASPLDDDTVIFHAGLSYGGVLFDTDIDLQVACECLKQIEVFYSSQGFSKILIKLIPSIYSNGTLDFVEYCLFLNNFKLEVVEVSSIISLKKDYSYNKMRKRRIRHAKKNNIDVINDWSYCTTFWSMLNNNLRDRHNTKPVHTLDEINELKYKFDKEIQLYVALGDNELLAGAIFFDTCHVRHLQYAATNRSGRDMSANDLVNHFAIEDAKLQNLNYFDFGISTENMGQVLNSGLFNYKNSYGSNVTLNKCFLKYL